MNDTTPTSPRPAPRKRPVAQQKPVKKKNSIFSFFGKLIRGIVMMLGTLVLVSIIATVFLASQIAEKTEAPLPSQFIVSLSLDEEIPEHENSGRFSFGPRASTISQLVDALDRAAKDPRVKGFAVNVDGNKADLATVYELAEAVKRFRTTAPDKFTIIYGTSYGSPGAGLGLYYLASGFQEIWMQPMGELSISGIRAEMPYGRAALDKIGIEPQFFARKEYKAIFEGAMANEMSAATKESLQTLLDDISLTLMTRIAENRKASVETLKGLMEQGIFTDEEALKSGLITNLGDIASLDDQVSTKMTGKSGAQKLFVNLNRYAQIKQGPQTVPATPDTRPKVALVYVTGMIVPGSDSNGGGFGESSQAFGADIANDILDAADDPNVKAIVMRVSSPGGSPEGSETIRLALLRAKAKGKPIIVSMGGEAASGGYWVSSPADRIFALPVTLTGSIGVAGGKFVLAGLWEKLGINWQYVQSGASTGMWSMNEPFDEHGTERMNALMDYVYDGFIKRVAEGRKMTIEQADSVARGRVWSGNQGLKAGLVDEIGGLSAALDYVAKTLKLNDRTQLSVSVFPEPKSKIERIVELLESQTALMPFLGNSTTLAPLMDMMNAPAGVLTYEPARIR